jgi:hypothetical protein
MRAYPLRRERRELGAYLECIALDHGMAATGIVLAWVVARSEMRRRLGGGAQNNSEER